MAKDSDDLGIPVGALSSLSLANWGMFSSPGDLAPVNQHDRMRTIFETVWMAREKLTHDDTWQAKMDGQVWDKTPYGGWRRIDATFTDFRDERRASNTLYSLQDVMKGQKLAEGTFKHNAKKGVFELVGQIFLEEVGTDGEDVSGDDESE